MSDDEEQLGQERTAATNSQDTTNTEPKKLSKILTDFDKKINQTGIVYISRVPPRTSPNQIKCLLERYGKIDRIYLTPKDNKSKEGNKKLVIIKDE